MNKLPFVVQPKHEPIIEYIGSEESGQIAIERRGYLTSGEKAFVQQALGVDETSLKVISLSRKVSSKRQIALDEAYRQVVAIISGQAVGSEELREIEGEYFEEFSELVSHLANVQSREQILKALCMVKYRINNECDVNDVLELHPDIINGLGELYNQEENKSIERLMSTSDIEATAASEVHEAEGKVDVVEMEKKRRSRGKTASE